MSRGALRWWAEIWALLLGRRKACTVARYSIRDGYFHRCCVRGPHRVHVCDRLHGSQPDQLHSIRHEPGKDHAR